MKRIARFLILITVLLAISGFYISNQKKYADEADGWNLILVNEEYYIPEGYTVELTTLDNGERVDSRISEPLQEMFNVAELEGVYMVVADGYRTREEQQRLMNEKVEEYQERVYVKFVAEKLAQQWVAIPGTSEHQLGLAVDINADAINSTSSEVYGWLAENAHKFGFIRRYPPDKTEITGISNEPWHYRYVGEEVAQEMYEAGICLEEYIDRLDK